MIPRPQLTNPPNQQLFHRFPTSPHFLPRAHTSFHAFPSFQTTASFISPPSSVTITMADASQKLQQPRPQPPPSPIFNYSPLRYSPTPLPVPDIDPPPSPTKPQTVQISRKEWRESLSTIIRPTPRYVSLQTPTPNPTPLHWRRAISTPQALSEDSSQVPFRHLLSPTAANVESPDGIISNFFESPQHPTRFGAASTPGWLPPSPNAPMTARPPIMIARRRPENQDCYCIYAPFPSIPISASARRTHTADGAGVQGNGDVLIGIFDGHGDAGRRIAHFTRAFLTEALSCATQGFYKALLEGVASGSNVSLATAIHGRRWKMFIQAFEATDKSLRAPTSRSAYGDSGSTALVAFLSGWDLYVAWVGHSRCVVGRRLNDLERYTSYAAVNMSRDHTTDSVVEMKRIRNEARKTGKKKRGGNQSLEFLRKSDLERRDEVCVTRSLGDKSGNQFGCTAEPEVTYRRLCEGDGFLVVGSSGVWGVLSSQEAVNIVGRKRNSGASAEGAASEVVKEAKRRWRRKCCRAQDISVIVMWLSDGNWDNKDELGRDSGFKASLKRLTSRLRLRKGSDNRGDVFSVACDGSLKVFSGDG